MNVVAKCSDLYIPPTHTEQRVQIVHTCADGHVRALIIRIGFGDVLGLLIIIIMVKYCRTPYSY